MTRITRSAPRSLVLAASCLLLGCSSSPIAPEMLACRGTASTLTSDRKSVAPFEIYAQIGQGSVDIYQSERASPAIKIKKACVDLVYSEACREAGVLIVRLADQTKTPPITAELRIDEGKSAYSYRSQDNQTKTPSVTVSQGTCAIERRQVG